MTRDPSGFLTPGPLGVKTFGPTLVKSVPFSFPISLAVLGQRIPGSGAGLLPLGGVTGQEAIAARVIRATSLDETCDAAWLAASGALVDVTPGAGSSSSSSGPGNGAPRERGSPQPEQAAREVAMKIGPPRRFRVRHTEEKAVIVLRLPWTMRKGFKVYRRLMPAWLARVSSVLVARRVSVGPDGHLHAPRGGSLGG